MLFCPYPTKLFEICHHGEKQALLVAHFYPFQNHLVVILAFCEFCFLLSQGTWRFLSLRLRKSSQSLASCIFLLCPPQHTQPHAFLRPGLLTQLSTPKIFLHFFLIKKMHPTVFFFFFFVKLVSHQSWTSHFLKKHMSFPISEKQELVLFIPAPSSVPRTHALISGSSPIVIVLLLSAV